MDKDNKLFTKMEIAAKAIALCCDDDRKSPVAKSEVYNETWMLRLALAFIHDHIHIDDSKDSNPLSRIAKAVKRSWISEGGLAPVFDNEGTTWTDAILGDVKLEEKTPGKKEKTKRGVLIDKEGNPPVGVIVIEAKMNSDLAPGVTHASDYNQVARNIACLASLVMEHKAIAEESAFFVFAPRSNIDRYKIKIGECEECDIKNYLDCEKVLKTINDQSKDRSRMDVHGKPKQLPARPFTEEFIKREAYVKKFEEAINYIVKNSSIISWEEVIQSVACVNSESDRDALKYFYMKACDEYKLKTDLKK